MVVRTLIREPSRPLQSTGRWTKTPSVSTTTRHSGGNAPFPPPDRRSMDIEQLIAIYGPLVITIGAAFEGQTAVVIGGILAHNGVLSLGVVFATGALGSGVLDHLLFVLGRSFRHTAFVQRFIAKPGFAKTLQLIERYPNAFILSFRFLFGLRAAGPVAVGVSQVSHWRFGILNALGSCLWSGLFAGFGYALGPVALTLFDQLGPHAGSIALAVTGLVLVAGLIAWRWHVWNRRERPIP